MGSSAQSHLYLLQRELSFRVEKFLSSDRESDRIDALDASQRLSRALEKPTEAVYKLSLMVSPEYTLRRIDIDFT